MRRLRTVIADWARSGIAADVELLSLGRFDCTGMLLVEGRLSYILAAFMQGAGSVMGISDLQSHVRSIQALLSKRPVNYKNKTTKAGMFTCSL